jgi:predicted transcriptional regulator
MRYPPDAYKKEHKKNSGKSEDVNEKSIEEIIKEMEVREFF